jgi:GNAT superfamily N-acetyltransferase
MISPLDIEFATYVSWPAFEQHDYRGWILRFAEGCTKRANSANAIVPIQADLSETVDYCEAFYRTRSQPVIFRLPSFVENTRLDSYLADRGYSLIDPSLVLYRALDPTEKKGPDFIKMERNSWLEANSDISGVDAAKQAIHAKILERIPVASLFTAVKDQDRPVTCGLGVIHETYFGIFDIMTKTDFRRRGHGTQLIEVMLSWARRNGARHAYVQVMANNAPAVRLYEKFGYRRLYHYWYRIKKLGDLGQSPAQVVAKFLL